MAPRAWPGAGAAGPGVWGGGGGGGGGGAGGPARHTHPGDEIGYVLEGEGQLLVDGAAPRLLRAGDAFVVPAGVVHDAHNPGGAAMRLVGVFVVDKTKPLAAPAQ
nr:cupin domain-containing protein [Massilia aquatica]